MWHLYQKLIFFLCMHQKSYTYQQEFDYIRFIGLYSTSKILDQTTRKIKVYENSSLFKDYTSLAMMILK